jgi:hypothetical protein
VHDIVQTYEREVRDLPCFEYLTTVVLKLYRVRCPDCGVKAGKVPLLPSKAPFSKRFEDAVGEACEALRPVAWPGSLACWRAPCGSSITLSGTMESAAAQVRFAADGRG